MNMPKFKLDTIFALLCIVVFCFTLISSWSWDPASLLFVWFVSIPGLGCMSVFFARQLIQMRRGDGELTSQRGQPLGSDVVTGRGSREEVMFFGRLFGLLVAIWLLGFEIGALLFALIYLRFKARESWPLSIVLTALLAALILGILGKLLHVGWPQATLRLWLGL